MSDAHWPYLPTFLKLALALGLGLFVGIERERRRKEAGMRTFAFAAVLGAVGGLLGYAFALLALTLIGVLVLLLNIETIRTGEGVELTTSAALLITACVGILAGQGHTFTPTVIGVMTAALLAWKTPLADFSHALTESELRSAILLAILTFVVYPVLPRGTLDRWDLVNPRTVWMTVILIAAVGFLNYVLLKIYGRRGLAAASFLGGLVNSTVTVADLSERARQATDARMLDAVHDGVLLARAAMLLRNGAIVAILAPMALTHTVVPLALMLVAAVAPVLWRRRRRRDEAADPAGAAVEPALTTLRSPFSLTAAFRFGVIFLVLHVTGTLAARMLGAVGEYAVSAIGGLVSSASAVASAAALGASGTLTPQTAGLAAILASLTSAAITVPFVARIVGNRRLTRQIVVNLGGILAAAAIGVVVQAGVLAAIAKR
jgi:uncharacterized membrane protein (DUF4010 family)